MITSIQTCPALPAERETGEYFLPADVIFAVRPQPGVQQKPILAAAMRGILPERILNRRRKGHFNEIYYEGRSRNLRNLEALIEQAPVDDLGFLDGATLLDCLQRAALGNATDAPSLSPLDRTLSLLFWLTRQHRRGGSRADRLLRGEFGRRESVDRASMAA